MVGYGVVWSVRGGMVCAVWSVNLAMPPHRLLNNLHPKTVKKINNSKLQFKQTENINKVHVT